MARSRKFDMKPPPLLEPGAHATARNNAIEIRRVLLDNGVHPDRVETTIEGTNRSRVEIVVDNIAAHRLIEALAR